MSNRDIETVDMCTVCLRDVWNCTCHHDSIESGQFLTVGKEQAEQIAGIRKGMEEIAEEDKWEDKKKEG